jgi:hypothetical protein
MIPYYSLDWCEFFVIIPLKNYNMTILILG